MINFEKKTYRNNLKKLGVEKWLRYVFSTLKDKNTATEIIDYLKNHIKTYASQLNINKTQTTIFRHFKVKGVKGGWRIFI